MEANGRAGCCCSDEGHGMTIAHPGGVYRAKGCAMVPKKSLQLIEEKPGRYRVRVATKGRPGDLRGKLFPGMAHV